MPALIFDYDGLIVDSETVTATVVIDLFAERGVRIELADLASFFGASGEAVDLAWERWLKDSLGADVDLASFHEVVTHQRHAKIEGLPLLPGVSELIDEAKGLGWKVGLATGHDRVTLIESLQRLAIHEDFDAIVTAEDVQRPKPAPDVFLETALQLNVEPQTCVVLEDSLAGHRAATDAGMSVIICPCGVTRSSKFPSEAVLVESLLHVDLAKFR